MAYRRYWTERKYIDGVGTEEYRKIDELYDNETYGSYDDCVSGTPQPPTPGEYYDEYFTVEALENGKIEQAEGGNMLSTVRNIVKYSVNGGEWKSYSELPENVSAGDKVRFKAVSSSAYYLTTTNSSVSSTVYSIIKTPKCNIYGNINSMYAGDDFKTNVICYNNMFYHWFDFLDIVDASNLVLPYTTLAERCYNNMFLNCRSLVNAPQLPATELAPYCYQNMFSSCYSLTTAPQLPAMKLSEYCYSGMFHTCQALTDAKLPATELAESCYYQMFYNCTALTTAPQLPATKLAKRCYFQMFYRCTALVNPPQLPATTLAEGCYENMFESCTSLTTPPALPATELAESCYYMMFYRCTGLKTAPQLPATKLGKKYCYSNMFESCTALTKAPDLLAEEVLSQEYNRMFYGCSNLSYVKCLVVNKGYGGGSGGFLWLHNVSPTGTFVKKRGVNWSTGENGIPSGWTVEEVD